MPKNPIILNSVTLNSTAIKKNVLIMVTRKVLVRFRRFGKLGNNVGRKESVIPSLYGLFMSSGSRAMWLILSFPQKSIKPFGSRVNVDEKYAMPTSYEKIHF